MECYRIDESGYTGFDLLNRAQPVEGAASIAIKDDEAARLIKSISRACRQANSNTAP